MSRIGKKPIPIPPGVAVTVDGGCVYVKGLKGELKRELHSCVSVSQKDNQLSVSVAAPDDNEEKALWGLSRKLIANMIEGVTQGFVKKLELVGVGYRAAVAGQKLTLQVGFSHPVDFLLPVGITAGVEKNTIITLNGIDKELLGNVAAAIRGKRKPEPYKGKGIRYEGEAVRIKPGKAAKAAGAAGGAA